MANYAQGDEPNAVAQAVLEALYQVYPQLRPSGAKPNQSVPSGATHMPLPVGSSFNDTVAKGREAFAKAYPQLLAPSQQNPNDIYAILRALYAKYNVAPGPRRSGFADIDYWAEHPSEVLNGRLERDIQGIGSDNPEGTPWGQGPWMNSGRGSAVPTTPGSYTPPNPPPYIPSPYPTPSPTPSPEPTTPTTPTFPTPNDRRSPTSYPDAPAPGGDIDIDKIVNSAISNALID